MLCLSELYIVSSAVSSLLMAIPQWRARGSLGQSLAHIVRKSHTLKEKGCLDLKEGKGVSYIIVKEGAGCQSEPINRRRSIEKGCMVFGNE